jgi:hypothetical protein
MERAKLKRREVLGRLLDSVAEVSGWATNSWLLKKAFHG